MTMLLEKTKSKRKTFTLPNYIVQELEEFAQAKDEKQSQIIAKALEEYLKKKRGDELVKKRVRAFGNILSIAPKGSLKNLDLKDVLKEKAINHD